MNSVFSWKRTFESVFMARSSPPGLCNVNNLAGNLSLKRPAHIPPSTLKENFHSNVCFEKWNDTENTRKVPLLHLTTTFLVTVSLRRKITPFTIGMQVCNFLVTRRFPGSSLNFAISLLLRRSLWARIVQNLRVAWKRSWSLLIIFRTRFERVTPCGI